MSLYLLLPLSFLFFFFSYFFLFYYLPIFYKEKEYVYLGIAIYLLLLILSPTIFFLKEIILDTFQDTISEIVIFIISPLLSISLNLLLLTKKGKETLIYSFILSKKSIILKRVQIGLILLLFISYKIVLPSSIKNTKDTNELSNKVQQAIEKVK
jgi:hypothetical protein